MFHLIMFKLLFDSQDYQNPRLFVSRGQGGKYVPTTDYNNCLGLSTAINSEQNYLG